MDRKIESIKVLKGKYNTTVYINFDGGRFGTHTKEDGKWFDSGLTADELTAAKSLALKDGKWTNYRAPRAETFSTGKRHSDDEDARADLEADRNFHQPVTFASHIDANS